MGLAYERKEDEQSVSVRWRRLVWFYAGALVFMAVSVANHLAGVLIAAGAMGWAVAHLVDLRRTWHEIRAARAANRLTVKGRRFSFRDPLTYEIRKV